MSKVKTRRLTPPTRLLLGLLVGAFVCTCSALPSCNLVRTITNESKSVQKGDTSILIQTKTIESYDASKKLN